MSLDTIIIIAVAVAGIIGSIKKSSDKASDKTKQRPRPNIFTDFESILTDEEQTPQETSYGQERSPYSQFERKQHLYEPLDDIPKEEAVSSTDGYRGVQSSIMLDVNEGFEHEKVNERHHVDIDPNKLIIYSELMRPKWNEF
ncbi:MAG: hypothetical protein PHD11_02315 [Bacteroidales bacterium]|nr:hypothetical protein [Bacteroidales bacterium]MDD4669902.1 hypothetical protein [Bacteroidales bacterium]